MLQTPRGRDGDGLSLDLTGSGRCVLERSRVEGLGEVWGDELDRIEGLEGFWWSTLGVRLLGGLLQLLMYVSISLARSRHVVGVLQSSWSHSCTVSVAIRDRGSNPVSIPVLLTVPALKLTLLSTETSDLSTTPLQLTLLSTRGLCLSVSSSSSSTPCSLSAARCCCFAEPRWGTLSLRVSSPPDKSRDLGLSVFGTAPHRMVSPDGLETSRLPLPETSKCSNTLISDTLETCGTVLHPHDGFMSICSLNNTHLCWRLVIYNF